LRILDSHLDSSLQPEQSLKLTTHLQGCQACTQELENRRNIRSRLRSATRRVEPPGYLETRIRAHVQTSENPRPWLYRLAAVAAMVAVCAGAVIAYERGHLRFTRKTQESYIAYVSGSVPALMRVGLGDHVHCSVFRKYPKNLPSVEQLSNDLAPEFRGLVQIVQEHVPGGYRLMMSHQCHYHSRSFIHVSFMSGSKQLSLMISKKGDGESFRATELLPALSESGIPLYASGVQRFQMAAFETGGYLVYVISELSRQKNIELMQAMAPELNAFFGKIPG
jgi:hypothetical protein